jgi:hypothetical protein
VSFPKTGIIPSPKEVLDGLRAFDAYKAEVDKTKADIAEINEAFHLWLYAVHTLGKFKLRGDSITVLKAIANLDRVVFDEEQKLYADNDKYINAKELVRIDDNFKTPRGRVEVQAVTVASALVRTVNNGHDAELTFN